MQTDWGAHGPVDGGRLPPIEGLFQSLALEGRSVLMVGEDEALLDLCGQSLVRKLRQNQSLEVAALFDMNREVLLQRFNRLLEDLSVDQALQAGQQLKPSQVWLQHVHNAEQLEQAKLLIRLSSDFPAAQVRLLLMANPLCADDLMHHGMTKKMIVWHAPATRKAKDMGLSKPLAATAPGSTQWIHEVASPEPLIDFVFSNGDAPVVRTASQKPSQRWVVVLLLGVFVLVSAAVLGLHLWQSAPTSPANSPNEAVSTSSTGLVSAATTDPLALVPPLPSVPPTTPAGEVSDGAIPSLVLPPQTSLTETQNESKQPETVVNSPPKVIDHPSLGWARGLRSSQWVVQHVALDSETELLTWREQHPSLKTAKAVPLRRPTGQRYWVLVSGPFDDQTQAGVFAKSSGVPPDPWLRRVTSLQASLDTAP